MMIVKSGLVSVAVLPQLAESDLRLNEIISKLYLDMWGLTA